MIKQLAKEYVASANGLIFVILGLMLVGPKSPPWLFALVAIVCNAAGIAISRLLTDWLDKLFEEKEKKNENQ